ncbi:MAG: hypothetical protein CMB77_07245 [Euryarchaeota archaeon]|nr:hypothetical protein [Euryarchaeota archaeon]
MHVRNARRFGLCLDRVSPLDDDTGAPHEGALGRLHLVADCAKCSATDDVGVLGGPLADPFDALALHLGVTHHDLAVIREFHRTGNGVCDLRKAVPVEAFHVRSPKRKRAAPKDGPCVPVCVAAAYDSFAM